MRGALLLSLQSLRSSTRSHYCDRQRHLVTQRRRRCLFHAEPAAAPTSRPPPSAAASVSSSDVVLRYLSVNGEIAVLVADATRLVVHAAALHCTSPTATAALGRALVGALLLSGFKEAVRARRRPSFYRASLTRLERALCRASLCSCRSPETARSDDCSQSRATAPPKVAFTTHRPNFPSVRTENSTSAALWVQLARCLWSAATRGCASRTQASFL